MTLLTADQLGVVLDRTRQDLFRIETLPSYDTAMTTGDFRRWLDGEDEPTYWTSQSRTYPRNSPPRRATGGSSTAATS